MVWLTYGMAMLTATEPRAKKLTYKGLWSSYFTLKDRGYTFTTALLTMAILTTGYTYYWVD